MRILHAYCLNYNLGDHALGFGAKHLLRQALPVTSIGEVNLQGQVFDPYFIDVVNRNYDLLVLGGGGIIHGEHWPQGWFWLVEQALIQTIKTPFIVLAAGYNYFKDEDGIPERGKRHLVETARLARLFSVRNDSSHARLQADTGISADILADPGFWVGRNRSFDRPGDIPDSYVLLQLANDKLDHRLHGSMGYEDLVGRLRTLVTRITRDHHVLFCPHVLADLDLSRDVARDLGNVSIIPFHRFAFDNVSGLFPYYQHANAVIAMRGHGQILALAFGTPTISLENHYKHRGLMEDMGLDRFNVAIERPDLVEAVIDGMQNAISAKDAIKKQVSIRLDTLWDESVSRLSCVVNK